MRNLLSVDIQSNVLAQSNKPWPCLAAYIFSMVLLVAKNAPRVPDLDLKANYDCRILPNPTPGTCIFESLYQNICGRCVNVPLQRIRFVVCAICHVAFLGNRCNNGLVPLSGISFGSHTRLHKSTKLRTASGVCIRTFQSSAGSVPGPAALYFFNLCTPVYSSNDDRRYNSTWQIVTDVIRPVVCRTRADSPLQ